MGQDRDDYMRRQEGDHALLDMRSVPPAPPLQSVPIQWPPKERLPTGHVAADHYLDQFDRYPAGDTRFAALAAHCAFIYNHNHDDVRELEAKLEEVVGRLRAGDTPVAIALDLHEYLEERTR